MYGRVPASGWVGPTSKRVTRPWSRWIDPHAYESGDYLRAFLTGHLAQTFGLFPHLGIAWIGVVIGLRLAGGSAACR